MTRASHHFMIPLRSWFGNIIDRNVVVEGIFSSAPQAGGWASLKEISRVLIVTVVNTPIKVVLFRILPEVYSPADRQNIYLFYLCQGCFSFTIQCILGGLFLKFVFICVNFSWRKWRKTTAFCLSKKRETLLSYHYFLSKTKVSFRRMWSSSYEFIFKPQNRQHSMWKMLAMKTHNATSNWKKNPSRSH